MPVLNIDGIGRVTVTDNFLQLSPDDQQKWVNDFAHSRGVTPQSLYGHQAGTDSPAQPAQGTAQPSAAQQAPSQPPAPTQPSTPSYDGSGASWGNLTTAAMQSLAHGLPAALENGAAVLGRSLSPEAGKALWEALAARAAQNRQEQAKNYQHPAGVDPSPFHALMGGNIGGAFQSLGYTAAENAGPLAAGIGALAIPGAGVPLAGAIGGVEAADNISQEKKAAGLRDADTLNKTDAANVAAQTLLNALPMLKAGQVAKGLPLLGDVVPKTLGRGALNIADQGIRGTADNLMDQGSIKVQGGDVGTVGDVLRNAFDAGLTRAAVAGAPALPMLAQRGAKQANYLRNRYGTEFGQGLSEYKQGVKNNVPLSQMSDKAKAAVASLDYGSSIADRMEAQGGEGTGATVANGALGAAKLQLENIRDAIKSDPVANGVKAMPKEVDRAFSEAIREAQNHNMNIAASVSGNAAPTAHQRLQAMLPDDVWRPIEARLHTMDRMSSDRVQKRTKPTVGPVLRAVAKPIVPTVMAGLGFEAGHPVVGSAIGALSAAGSHALGAALDHVGAGVDRALGFGFNVPKWQRHMSQKLDTAERMGVAPRPIGEQLNDIEAATGLLSARSRQARAQSQVQSVPVVPSQPANQSSQVWAPGLPPKPVLDALLKPSPGRQPVQSSPARPTQAPMPAQAQSGPVVPPAPPMPFHHLPILPMAHTAAEIVQQRVPGWAAKTAEGHPDVSKTSIMSYLSNRLADKRITPEEYNYLISHDDIGENMPVLQREIGGMAHAGLWPVMSAFRDPKAPETLSLVTSSVNMALGKLAEAKRDRMQSGSGAQAGLMDFDGKPVRNALSYQAAIQRERDQAVRILAAHPDLGRPVAAIREQKTPDNRNRAMLEEIMKLPEEKRLSALLALSPLTVFGYKGEKKING